MKTPVDRAYNARRLLEQARELFRSVDHGGQGKIDLGRDAKRRRLILTRAPQYADAYPDCLQPAVQLWLRVEDEAGRDVTPPILNPVYVVGSDCTGDTVEWLQEMARLAVTAPATQEAES